MANYGRKLRMEANIKKKEKVERAIEFVKQLAKKLVSWYVSLYIIDEIVSINMIKLLIANINKNLPSCEY